VDEAAALGADSLVLVLGAADGVTLSDGRQMAEDGIAALVPYALEHGVRLGLEPLHPMFAADRSVLVTLDQSLQLAAAHNSNAVGVIVDVFHVWWDPQVFLLIAQAGKRIFGFHVSDWLVPLPDTLMGRGMMGDGVIEIKPLRAAVDAAGYIGPIEVEIFNQKLWDSPPDTVLPLMVERFLSYV
jgi:sugar phosphate isomerase/epimerase